MNCQEVESLLLQSEMNQAPDGVFVRFAGDAAREVADHLASCAACNQLARKLRRLEKVVRSLPEPIGMLESKNVFVENLQGMVPEVEPIPVSMPIFANSPTRPLPSRKRRVVYKSNIFWRIADSRITAAALVLLVIGGSVWTYLAREEQVLASAQALNNLVEWNLKLAEHNTTLERQRLYAARAEAERQLAMRAHLNADDRRQADTLIRNGEFLSTNEDPLAEADHFSQMADVLITKMASVATKAPETLARFSDTYLRVVDEGIHKNLDRAEAAGTDTAATQKQFATIDRRDSMLQMKVEALLDLNPTPSQPQLKRALAIQKQYTEQHRGANKRQPQR